MSHWIDRIAVFDLETTGVNVERDRIVSAHVGELDASGAVVSRRDWLVNPGVPIPEGATAVHGISTARAEADGLDAATAVAEIVETLRAVQAEGLAVIAYNAPYDFTLLDREAKRYGFAPFVPDFVIDPLILDKGIDKYRRGKRTLAVACEVYGVSLDDAHEASADAIAAGRVAQALVRRATELAALSPEDIFARQQDWQREQAESFADWKRRNGSPDFVADVGWPVR